jgi:glutathione S-transferase
MIKLYDNPFSPFARKVRMALFWKNLSFESVDALALRLSDALAAVNPRREVPVLLDGDLVVVNSADIVAYLDHRYGPPLVLPEEPAARVRARAWERLADGVIDAIVHDVSLWAWPTHRRTDRPPDGLVEAGRRDLDAVLASMEAALAGHDFLCGALSVADLALFPHVASLRLLGMPPDPERRPLVSAWLLRMRALPMVRRDVETVRRGVTENLSSPDASPYESERVVWRGDRLEWLFANGFHEWWVNEAREGRAVVPSSFPVTGCNMRR